MTNEHREDIAEAAPETDDGPLDPSVFFGLFDDLGDSTNGGEPAEQEQSEEPDQSGGDVPDQEPPGEPGLETEPASQAEPVPQSDDVGHVDDTPPAAEDEAAEDEQVEQGQAAPEQAWVDQPEQPSPVPQVTEPAPNDEGGAAQPNTATADSTPSQHFGETGHQQPNGSAPHGATAHVIPSSPAAPQPTPAPTLSANGANPIHDVVSNGVANNGAGTIASPASQSAQANSGQQQLFAQPAAPTNQPLATMPGSQQATTAATAINVAAKQREVEAQARPLVIPVQRERSGGTVAKAALITIAGGLFAGLILAFIVSLSTPEPGLSEDQATQQQAVVDGDPAASTVVEALSLNNVSNRFAQGTVSTEEVDELFSEEITRHIAESRLDLTSLAFEPGTTNLSDASNDIVAKVGGALAANPDAPAAITVRTYSERTATANLELSRQQAIALVEAFEAAGAAPGQVRAVGLGAPPLSSAQPVPGFVAVTSEFGTSLQSETLSNGPTFMFGSNVADSGSQSWPLRVEALVPLQELGQALQAGPGGSIGLAGYSFLADGDERNRAMAAATTETVAGILADGFGFDQTRVSVVIPGTAPFVPSPDVSNLIWLVAGPDAAPTYEVAGIDIDGIDFDGDRLQNESIPAVEALASVLSDTGASVVIDVRSYDGGGVAANTGLSGARAEAIVGVLVDAGVPAEQVRTAASGASSYHSADGPLVTVTVLP